MPEYEYLCQDCHKTFDVHLSLDQHEHDKGQVKCPQCGSTNVDQQMAAFFVVTSKKS